jgi:hypothetical protein
MKVKKLLCVLILVAILMMFAIPAIAAPIDIDVGGIIQVFPKEIAMAFWLVFLLIACDFILGVIAAIRDGTFDAGKLPEFIKQNVFPYIGGLLILALFALASPEIKIIFFSAAAAATIKFLKDLKDKVIAIFGPLPDKGT